MDAPVDRLIARVEKREDGCWLWTGTGAGKGYGQMVIRGRKVYIHRASYEFFVGPIPEGMQIDHLCRNRLCANPTHLEPVTNQENTLRGLRGRLVTECVRGHPYTPENTYIRPGCGRRMCRTCYRLFRGRKRPPAARTA